MAEATGTSSGSSRRGAASIENEIISPEDERLFDTLRAHRLSLAQAEGVPPYVVASDRTLREISQLRPKTRMELLDAHGIGEAKADRYGPGFLEIVRQAGEPRIPTPETDDPDF